MICTLLHLASLSEYIISLLIESTSFGSITKCSVQKICTSAKVQIDCRLRDAHTHTRALIASFPWTHARRAVYNHPYSVHRHQRVGLWDYMRLAVDEPQPVLATTRLCWWWHLLRVSWAAASEPAWQPGWEPGWEPAWVPAWEPDWELTWELTWEPA